MNPSNDDLQIGRTVWVKDHSTHGYSGEIVHKEEMRDYACRTTIYIAIKTERELKIATVSESDSQTVFLTPWALKIAKSKEVQQSITRLTNELAQIYEEAQKLEQQSQQEQKTE